MNMKTNRAVSADYRDDIAAIRAGARPALMLSRRPAAELVRASADAPAKHAAKHTVLVVESITSVCDFLARALKMSGFGVATAKSPVEALILTDYLEPAAILIDASTTRGNMSTLSMLRARCSKSAIIMLAARPATSDARDALLAGADDYVVGPISKELVKRILHESLRNGLGPPRREICVR